MASRAVGRSAFLLLHLHSPGRGHSPPPGPPLPYPQAWRPIAAFIRSQESVPAIQLAHAGRKASTSEPFVEGGRPLIVSDRGLVMCWWAKARLCFRRVKLRWFMIPTAHGDMGLVAQAGEGEAGCRRPPGAHLSGLGPAARGAFQGRETSRAIAAGRYLLLRVRRVVEK